MPLAAYANTITAIFNSVLDEGLAPLALESIANLVGAAGASYLRMNTLTQRVSSVRRWGSFTGTDADYLARYSEIDSFRVVREGAAGGTLLKLTERLPQARLRRDAWFNEYLLGGGICDLVGTKLHETSSHVVLVAIHRASGDAGPFPRNEGVLQSLMAPLQNAARLHVGLIEDGYRAAPASIGFGHPKAGIIFTDEQGRIVDTNREGERILRRGDGLTLEKGRICARRSFETARLCGLIAEAAGLGAPVPSSGCMVIARDSGPPSYIVRVAPGGTVLGNDRPLAMVFISLPTLSRVRASDLGQLYGLSPAESRVAVALADGKRIAELVREFGVQMSTLRTQIRSILKKCEVDRQSDLIRLILSIPSADPAPNESDRW